MARNINRCQAGAGTFRTNGPTNTRPLTSSGFSAATMTAAAAPIELPITSAGPPRCSISAVMSDAAAGSS